MIQQNIKNNLKLSCYPTQLAIPYSRQDTEQKPLSRGLFSLTFYASFLKRVLKDVKSHRKSDTVTLSKYKKDPIQSKKAALSLF